MDAGPFSFCSWNRRPRPTAAVAGPLPWLRKHLDGPRYDDQGGRGQQEQPARGGTLRNEEGRRLHDPDFPQGAGGGAGARRHAGEALRRDRRRGPQLADGHGGGEAEAGALTGGAEGAGGRRRDQHRGHPRRADGGEMITRLSAAILAKWWPRLVRTRFGLRNTSVAGLRREGRSPSTRKWRASIRARLARATLGSTSHCGYRLRG